MRGQTGEAAQVTTPTATHSQCHSPEPGDPPSARTGTGRKPRGTINPLPSPTAAAPRVCRLLGGPGRASHAGCHSCAPLGTRSGFGAKGNAKGNPPSSHRHSGEEVPVPNPRWCQAPWQCHAALLTRWCISPLPLCEVMTRRSGLRLLVASCVLWGGGGGDLAGMILPKVLPLETGRRPGEARALT